MPTAPAEAVEVTPYFQRIARSTSVQWLGGMHPIAEMAAQFKLPEARELIDTTCTQCETPLRAPRGIAGAVACDPCRDRIAQEEAEQAHRKFWEQAALCPAGSPFRETSTEHPSFPKVQYEETRAWIGGESLFFFGATGAGKTRLAMHLLKRCLFKGKLHVFAMWPEDLKGAARSFERSETIARWGAATVLLMDDALLTGMQDEKVADFLKDLLDYRHRHGRTHIITSQVGGTDVKEQLEQWADRRGLELGRADRARMDALLRRVSELSRVVMFGTGAAASRHRDLSF